MRKLLINILFFLALLILVTIDLTSYRYIKNLSATNAWIVHTREVIQTTDNVLLALADAESNHRGYLIAGDEVYLDFYEAAITKFNDTFAKLTELTADNAAQQTRLNALRPLLKQRIAIFAATLADYKQKNPLSLNRGNLMTQQIQLQLSSINNAELLLLKERNDLSLQQSETIHAIILSADSFSLGLFLIVFFLFNYQLRARSKAEQAVQLVNAQLERGVIELKQYNTEITLLAEMSRALQSCLTTDEAYIPITLYCQQMLPFAAGILYVMHASHNYLELAASWGEPCSKEHVFSPDHCWALRSGQLHHADKDQQNLLCHHIKLSENIPAPRYICIPLIAQNDTLGLFYLELLPNYALGKNTPLNSNKQLLMTTVAEQISLALANIRLRETLRYQSIRDPLTSLFNRRYLEESLGREIQRAERKNTPIALIMLDVDQFKRFNDTYGHDAGDAVLRELGHVITEHIRESDIACRYGGEEFVLLLYEATVEIARERAEELRKAVHRLHVKYGKDALGQITISQGVALFPDHANNSAALITAADAALYQAKKAGRDRVVFYQ